MKKQDSIKNELEQIKHLTYLNFIDKQDVLDLLKCSVKTAERRIKKLGLIHRSKQSIDILREFNEGKTSKELSLKYKCSLENINQIARDANTARPVGFYNLIESDFKFFDNIDNEEKAYILGFIAADGHVGKWTMKIGLASYDKDILLKIKKNMKSDAKIKIEEKLCSFNNKKTEVALFEINSSYLCNRLRELGFKQNKTIEFNFPDIPKSLYPAFIRGYFDGDGSFSKYCTGGYYKYHLSICGTLSLLNSIKNYLEETLNINFNSKIEKRFNTENCCYELRSSGKSNVYCLLDFLYQDASIYLDRKFIKYKNLKK